MSADHSEGATVPVAVVSSRTEAELIVGLLRNNDLRAAVSADDAGGLEPQLQLHGVRVLVAPSDEAPARRLLAAADTRERRKSTVALPVLSGTTQLDSAATPAAVRRSLP
jgi:hypothetical protein